MSRCRRNLVRRLGDLPGVFEYEVTESMGEWQALHPNSSEIAFRARLKHEVTIFKDQK